MPKYKYTQLVECSVPVNTTNGQQFYFQDIPQLRGKQISFVESFNSLDVAVSPITSGAAVITPAIMVISFLTLFLWDIKTNSAIGEQINKIPLTVLHRVNQNATATASPYVLGLGMLENYIVNWDKSYVTVSAPGITTTPTLSYLFNVGYL